MQPSNCIICASRRRICVQANSDFFEEGIGVVGVVGFVDPEEGEEVVGAGVGDVVGEPYGHVDESGLAAVEVEGEDLFGADASQFDAGLSFNHGEPFGFAGVVVVSAGDAGHGGGKGYLSAAVQLHGLHEGTALVGVQLQGKGKEGSMIDIGQEGIEEVAVEGIVEGRDDALLNV